jgi:hypothetical protein
VPILLFAFFSLVFWYARTAVWLPLGSDGESEGLLDMQSRIPGIVEAEFLSPQDRL